MIFDKWHELIDEFPQVRHGTQCAPRTHDS